MRVTLPNSTLFRQTDKPKFESPKNHSKRSPPMPYSVIPVTPETTPAVVATNTRALRLYEKVGFTRLGVIPKGFRLPDGTYADIVPQYIGS